MKLAEIQIGGRYRAKVSGQVQVVRVIAIEEVMSPSWSKRSTSRTLIIAINEVTGRRITIRSPQRLRRAMEN